MRRVIVALLLLVFLATAALGELILSDNADDYGLLHCVDECEVVVIGTVSLLTGVYHPRAQKDGSGMVCTDVLVRVDTFIKGQANVGTDYIKFIAMGGRAYHPGINEIVVLEVIPQAKFEVGEKVMLFIKTSAEPDELFYRNFPYGRSRLYMTTYGKRVVKDNKVEFGYDDGHGGEPKPVKLSLDLAKNLALAFTENKDAALQLENDIKAEVRTRTDNILSQSLATRLNNSAKQLIPSKEDE